MDTTTINFYESNAAEISQRYEGATSPVERYFQTAFLPGSKILDIGAGSGRDAARLIANGYDAYAVDPSPALLQASIALHPELQNRFETAALPEIGNPFGGGFDGILCSAVLMHVPPHALFDAALNIRSLLKPHARLLLSLPASRNEQHTENRDSQGRLFSPYTADEIQLLFERLGFQQIGKWVTSDTLGRQNTSWFTLLLELRNIGSARPIDKIEGILNRDKKVATYKLALFRALAEIATQESKQAVWLPNSEVGIPIMRIAERWLQYYWPLFASPRFIPQVTSESKGKDTAKPIKFRKHLTELAQAYSGQGNQHGISAWYLDYTKNQHQSKTYPLLKTTLKSICETIRDGPVEYSGGSLETGRLFRFDSTNKHVIMPADVWRELSLLGHWITDAVILRWAALTESFSKSQGITSGDVLPLLLIKPEPERATSLARQAFEKAQLNRCTWTGQSFKKDFAVDHAIAFSLWGNNDLWNLLQVNTKVNLNKSDKLPSTELLNRQKPLILEDWDILRTAMPITFDNQAAHLLGSTSSMSHNKMDELFARFKEAIELTALQRGVERWTPAGL